ncbi:hypothetical protein CRV00_11950 [Malaciobacter molluscorum]|uniref:tyrosine-type recombinase/integrase n=1 Tax=Malaciobacter molluscorum TaxID=1032072 RepID=UPI00100A3F7E|nr:tyrosine-type recombinase/integrase [Malaciobacter molluscorum]RXJ92854.1 hypothetical protein CRV00_11950 [Malaciobacter molluscorum]
MARKKTRHVGVYKEYKEKYGRECIYITYKIGNKKYAPRNLTILEQITDIDLASKRRLEIIDELKKGNDPFEKKEIIKTRTLNEHWEIIIQDVKKKRSKHTYVQYDSFWNKYIKDSIGNMYPIEIKSIHLDNILYHTTLKDQSDPYKHLLKRLLRMVYLKPIADGEVEKNPAEAYSFDLKMLPQKQKISKRTKLSHLEIAKKLYKQIPLYESQYKIQREEWRMMLYICILNARRYGEVFSLTYDNIDIKNKRIIAYKEQTKSNVDVWYPIPDECLEFFGKVNPDEKVFKHITYGGYYGVFQRLKEQALGKDDFPLTAHDVRSLFISILVDSGEDSKLIDMMLDHADNVEEIWKFYLDFSDEKKQKTWEKYWNIIRN